MSHAKNTVLAGKILPTRLDADNAAAVVAILSSIVVLVAGPRAQKRERLRRLLLVLEQEQ